MSYKTIKLPETFKEETMNNLLDELITIENNNSICCNYSRIYFDISELKRIGVGGITILANIVELLKSKDIQYFFNYGNNIDNICSRLIYSNFAKRYINNTIELQGHKDAIYLDVIKNQQVQNHISYKIIPWVSDCIGRKKGKIPSSTELASIQVALQEIFNNINDHSKVEVGCYFGYFEHNKNAILFCISDFGVGIPHKVRQKTPEVKTDEDAIKKACEKDYSTKSKPNNAGVGLFILKQNIILNKGSLTIFSNWGIYKIINFNGRMEEITAKAESFYPGTLIILEYPLDNIVFDDVEDEFDWGLDDL